MQVGKLLGCQCSKCGKAIERLDDLGFGIKDAIVLTYCSKECAEADGAVASGITYAKVEGGAPVVYQRDQEESA